MPYSACIVAANPRTSLFIFQFLHLKTLFKAPFNSKPASSLLPRT
jgi:hypothetical protein